MRFLPTLLLPIVLSGGVPVLLPTVIAFNLAHCGRPLFIVVALHTMVFCVRARSVQPCPFSFALAPLGAAGIKLAAAGGT
jgi:hypothetical protein